MTSTPGIRHPSASPAPDQPVERPAAPPPVPRVPASPSDPAAASARYLRTICNILVFWNLLIILGLLVWVAAMLAMANTV